MSEFVIRLAGVSIGVSCVYESTKRFCTDYFSDSAPEISVSVSETDIAREMNGTNASAKYLETLALYRKITDALIERDIILFHGSALEYAGAGYIFTAKSGTGKTTHSELWRTMLGDKLRYINGDKPLLRFDGSGITACGTPWRGKENFGENISAPVKAICVLERAEHSSIERISASEALPYLLMQTNRIADEAATLKTLSLIDRMCRETALYKLRCNMDISAARVSFEGMVSGV